MTKPTPTLLSIDQCDELVLAACTPKDGAIEDCEESTDKVVYFFESGTVGTVSRTTGAVQMVRGVLQ